MTIGYADGRVYEEEMHDHLDIPAMPSNKPQEQDPNQPKKVYFVRHGDTDLNEDDRCRGWSSVGLNADGRRDAQKAAESLSGTPVEHLVASDLERAQQTGRIISSKLGIPIEYDPGLRTWDTGHFTGRPNSEVKADLNRYTNEIPDERPPGSSESFNEFKDRVLGTLSGIIQRHNDKEIGVVSHNMVGRVWDAYDKAGQPQKAMAAWNWFTGGKPAQQSAEAAVDPTAWPSDKQSDEARDVNLSYGDPNARFLQPGLASTKQIPGFAFSSADRMSTREGEADILKKYTTIKPIDLEKADELNKAWLASHRSAVSQLGFDLEHYYEPPYGAPALNTAGITTTKGNEMWADVHNYNDPPSSIIHEAMHRGIEKLREGGRLKNTPYENYSALEEYLIRRLTEKHLGPKSSPGSEGERLLNIARKTIPDSDLDMIEKEAANFIAKKRPGGPR